MCFTLSSADPNDAPAQQKQKQTTIPRLTHCYQMRNRVTLLLTARAPPMKQPSRNLKIFSSAPRFPRRPHLFKPTHARVPTAFQDEGGAGAAGVGPDGLWRSRDHRKGRHRLPQDLMLAQKIARLFKPELMNLAWWIAFVSGFSFVFLGNFGADGAVTGFYDWVCCLVHKWILCLSPVPPQVNRSE